ncbi:MAG: hypothetical protein RSB71_02945 [Bacilli bacterium]
MIDIKDVFLVILYLALIILVIVSIVFMIKMMKTLTKVDKVVTDVDTKVKKLNGLFDMIDYTTDAITSFSDKIINVITSGISHLFNRKKKGDKDE